MQKGGLLASSSFFFSSRSSSRSSRSTTSSSSSGSTEQGCADGWGGEGCRELSDCTPLGPETGQAGQGANSLEQTPCRARSSVMESLAKRPFMPPMGQRYLQRESGNPVRESRNRVRILGSQGRESSEGEGKRRRGRPAGRASARSCSRGRAAARSSTWASGRSECAPKTFSPLPHCPPLCQLRWNHPLSCCPRKHAGLQKQQKQERTHAGASHASLCSASFPPPHCSNMPPPSQPATLHSLAPPLACPCPCAQPTKKATTNKATAPPARSPAPEAALVEP